MLELLANNATGMQNVYTPLPFKVHFIFCIIATLLYLVQFYRKRSAYYLLIMAAIDLTFVTQYWSGKPVIYALAAAEIVLIAAAVIASVMYNKKVKAENAEEIAQNEKEQEQKKAAEKLAGKIGLFELNTGAVARGFRKIPYPAPFLLKELHRHYLDFR